MSTKSGVANTHRFLIACCCLGLTSSFCVGYSASHTRMLPAWQKSLKLCAVDRCRAALHVPSLCPARPNVCIIVKDLRILWRETNGHCVSGVPREGGSSSLGCLLGKGNWIFPISKVNLSSGLTRPMKTSFSVRLVACLLFSVTFMLQVTSACLS